VHFLLRWRRLSWLAPPAAPWCRSIFRAGPRPIPRMSCRLLLMIAPDFVSAPLAANSRRKSSASSNLLSDSTSTSGTILCQFGLRKYSMLGVLQSDLHRIENGLCVLQGNDSALDFHLFGVGCGPGQIRRI